MDENTVTSKLKSFTLLYATCFRWCDIGISKLESSQSPHTFAKAMLFARWQHRLRFVSGFPYAPLKAMVTKISK